MNKSNQSVCVSWISNNDLQEYFLNLSASDQDAFLDDLNRANDDTDDAVTQKWISEQLKPRKAPRFQSAISGLIDKYGNEVDEFILLTNRCVDFLAHKDHSYADFLRKRPRVNPRVKINLYPVPGVRITYMRDVYPKVSEFLEKLEQRGFSKIYCNMTGASGAASAFALLAPAYFEACVFCQANDKEILSEDLPEEYASLIKKKYQTRIDTSILNSGIIGESQSINDIINRAKRLAKYDCNILLLGPSGTGKSKIARFIHEQSERSKEKFREFNCGGVDSQILESRLFGYKKGSFTGADKDTPGLFEETNGGTLFLDEIADCPRSLQDLLMTALQPKDLKAPTTLSFFSIGESKEKTTNLRIIAATNKDILKEIREKRFREDLYFRLARTTITMSALKDREDDAVLLAETILETVNEINDNTKGYVPKHLSESAKRAIAEYDWPGNVRQLENVITNAAYLTDDEEIAAEALDLPPPPAEAKEAPPDPEDFSLERIKDDLERRYINQALKVTKTKAEASRLLGMKSPANLESRLKALNKRLGPDKE